MSFEDLFMENGSKSNHIHPSAHIDKSAKLGAFNVIEAGVFIGAGVVIENFCEIMEGTQIGSNVTLRSYSRIGPHNMIEEGVTIKCSAITGPQVMIRKNAFIGPQTICFSDLESKVADTLIEENAIVGGGCRIMAGVVVGHDAFVGAGSVVTKNVFPNTTVVGVPAKELKNDG